MESFDILIGFIGGMTLAILGGLCVRIAKRYFATYRHGQRQKHIVREVFASAMSEKSLFRIEILQEGNKAFYAEGYCLAIQKKAMTLECTKISNIKHTQDMPCFAFLETYYNGKQAFFHFASHILSVDKGREQARMFLALPTHLELGQKRNFLRCKPPQDAIMAMGIWVLADGEDLPTHKGKIKDPLFMYRRHKTNSMNLNNISAGGVLISIVEHTMGEVFDQLSDGTNVLFLLGLGITKGNKKPLALWLSCRVTSLRHVEEDELWLLGMRFDSWASFDNAIPEIQWFSTSRGKSIPQVATWVMQEHLEQTKFL